MSYEPIDKTGSSRVSHLKEEVSEVKELAGITLGKVLERGVGIEEVTENAQSMTEKSILFEKIAKETANKQCWKNIKCWIILVSIILVILLIITAAVIIGVVVTTQRTS